MGSAYKNMGAWGLYILCCFVSQVLLELLPLCLGCGRAGDTGAGMGLPAKTCPILLCVRATIKFPDVNNFLLFHILNIFNEKPISTPASQSTAIVIQIGDF